MKRKITGMVLFKYNDLTRSLKLHPIQHYLAPLLTVIDL